MWIWRYLALLQWSSCILYNNCEIQKTEFLSLCQVSNRVNEEPVVCVYDIVVMHAVDPVQNSQNTLCHNESFTLMLK